MLRSVADVLASFTELTHNIETTNTNVSSSRVDFVCKTLESSGLSSSINTEQSETFSILKTERNTFYSKEWLSKHSCVNFTEFRYSHLEVLRIQSSDSLFLLKYILIHFNLSRCRNSTSSKSEASASLESTSLNQSKDKCPDNEMASHNNAVTTNVLQAPRILADRFKTFIS